MEVQDIHSWDVTFAEAKEIQNTLAEKIKLRKLKKKVSIVAGADVSYSKFDPRIFASVVVIKIPECEVIEVKNKMAIASFPYIPGLLSFRELPPLLKVFEILETTPDVIVCDGQGIAHPRGIGLASHLGLFLNIPTIGCGKTRLVGEYEEVPNKRWASSELTYQGKNIGAVFRTKEKVKPVFISPGHLINLDSSLAVIKESVTKFRLPEPTRLAHQYVNQFRIHCQALDK